MRLSQPRRATQLKIQASSACSATWLWLNTMCFVGSMPKAMNAEARSRVGCGRLPGPLPYRDRVQVDDTVEAVVAVLQLDEALDGAEIVAEMQVAGRLHAGKDPFLKGHAEILRRSRPDMPRRGAIVQGRCPSVKLRGTRGRRPLAPEDGSEALVERRLAAILAADAVGYSRLMRKDEPGALALLHKHRSEVIDPAIAKHRGRTVKLMGDGLLAEFSSVVASVDCAAEIP